MFIATCIFQDRPGNVIDFVVTTDWLAELIEFEIEERKRSVDMTLEFFE